MRVNYLRCKKPSRCLVFLGFASLVAVQTTFAQTKSKLPSKDEALALLGRAKEAVSLYGKGLEPFHLRLRMKSYDSKGAALEGTYETWWESSDHLRRETKWANETTVILADGDHLWELSQDNYDADSARFYADLNISLLFRITSEKQIKHIKAREIGGNPVTCVEGSTGQRQDIVELPPRSMGPNGVPSEVSLCFDNKSGLPVEAEVDSDHWEISGYLELGTRRFPREMRHLKGKKPLVELFVEKFEAFDPGQTDELAAPAGATARAWCSDMVWPRLVRRGSLDNGLLASLGVGPSGIVQNEFEVVSRYSYIVLNLDSEGHVRDARGFNYGHQDSMPVSEKKKYFDVEFTPATCKGKRVEMELHLELPTIIH